MRWLPHVVDRLPDEALAEEAAAALRTAGIDARVVTAELPSAVRDMRAQEGPKLVVAEVDADDAHELYAAWCEKVGLDWNMPGAPWRCGGCGERHGPNADTCWQCGGTVGEGELLEPASGPTGPATDEEPEDDAARRERLRQVLERVDARARDGASESTYGLKRVLFRLLVVILLAWGVKELVVWWTAG